MQVKLRRHFTGTYRATDLGGGAWRLADTSMPQVEIFLRGVQLDAAQNLSAIEIEWRDTATLLSASAPQGALHMTAKSAIVHEPLARLYDSLPLAQFDRQAQTFWRRVFRLVRIPGGRHLLGALARLSRKRS